MTVVLHRRAEIALNSLDQREQARVRQSLDLLQTTISDGWRPPERYPSSPLRQRASIRSRRHLASDCCCRAAKANTWSKMSSARTATLGSCTRPECIEKSALKKLLRYTFDAAKCRHQLAELGALLSSKARLNESRDVLPFFRRRNDLSMLIADSIPLIRR
jgi:hypothetical protein